MSVVLCWSYDAFLLMTVQWCQSIDACLMMPVITAYCYDCLMTVWSPLQKRIYPLYIIWPFCAGSEGILNEPSHVISETQTLNYLIYWSSSKPLKTLFLTIAYTQCKKRSCSKPKSVQRLGTVFSMLYYSWSENGHYFMSRCSIYRMQKSNIIYLD